MAAGIQAPIDAIVVGRFEIGEADRIIAFFSREHGKGRATARGVRRITSRLAGHLELFSHTRLWLHAGRSLDTITNASLTAGPTAWLDRPDRVGLAYVMAQVLDRLSAEGESQPELYDLAAELLAQLPGEAETPILELGFKLRFLDALGVRPVLDGCVGCATPTHPEMEYALDVDRGGLVCRSCGLGGYPVDSRTIKLWRLALEVPLGGLSVIRDGPLIASDSLDLVDSFYEFHFGRRFNGLPVGAH